MTAVHRVDLRSIQLEQKLADTDYDAALGKLSTSYTTVATGRFEIFVENEQKIEVMLTVDVGSDETVAVARLKSHFFTFSQALLETTRDWATLSGN